MSEQTNPVDRVRHSWQHEILGPLQDALEHNLSPLDRSALYACIPDCSESLQRVCNELLPALARTPPTDYATVHDLLFDIGGVTGELEHIRSHIDAARAAFDTLLKVLAHKADDSRQPEHDEERADDALSAET